MSSTNKVAAIVVFYNPELDFVDNIRCYEDDVGVIYVIDNSDVVLPVITEMLAALPKVIYIKNNGNLGIATALNIGVEQALKADYDFVLTMDQDSRATPGMVNELLDCIKKFKDSMIAIVTPYHQMSDTSTPPPGEWQEVEVAMTSGNLLSLVAYKNVGAFRDDYFIDFVDHEYCLRLRKNGYRIIRANRAVLKHCLGAITRHCLLWKLIEVGNHSPLRRYYAFRNRFHLHKMYKDIFPLYFKLFCRNIAQEIIGMLLFEQQKLAKLIMMWRGYNDYRKGISGRYMERQ
jgi:rhamnosyltransferase